jgi:hypothetical protein
MMVHAGALLAVLLYLAPVLMVVVARLRAETSPAEIVVDLVFAVSVDLLAILALALLVPLEYAVLLSRGLWIGAGVWHFWGRRVGPTWPSALARPSLEGAVLASASATLLSVTFSRPYAIWDRDWHIPLTASLRGQRLPFMNVYDFPQPLHYHFSGNVLAAALQTLSFDVLHASYALSLAHDLMFALTGLALALLLVEFGHRRVVTIAAGALAILLIGPVIWFRGGPGAPGDGYSILSFYQLSFRPHVSLAGLLFVGLLAATVGRLHARRPIAPARTVPGLLATAALLAITDETSLCLWGVALAAAWLVHPDIVHPQRGRGVVVFALLLAALILPNLLFRAGLSPGGPVQHLALVPASAPGYLAPTLSLETHQGLRALLLDIAVVLGACLALVGLLARSRDRRVGATVCLALVLAAGSTFLLTRLQINHDHAESHRSMTICLFVCPLLAVLFWPRLRRDGLGRPVFGLTVAGAVLSTLYWMHFRGPGAAQATSAFGTPDVHSLDCRSQVASYLGERPAPTYIARPVWYQYAGCHPVHTAGARGWPTMTVHPTTDRPAFNELDDVVGSSSPLQVVCPRRGSPAAATPDLVCADLFAHGPCRPSGDLVELCSLDAPSRKALVGKKW